MSLIILFYGLIVYINPAYKDTPVFFVFVGILMTGVFMLNYGQFVPAWDSNYYGDDVTKYPHEAIFEL
jgi:hypothetical protein